MVPRWLRRTGRIVAWPVTAPVDALARRVGTKAVEGAIDRITEVVAPHQETPMPSKSLFTSRVFWFNVLTAAAEVSGALTGVVSPGTLTLIVNGINIGLRLITTRPVHLTPPPPQ
jgi:hypothetical protein